MSASLYQAILGERFSGLPTELAAFHSLAGEHSFSGRARIVAAKNPLAKVLAMLMGLPREDAEVDLRFRLLASNQEELWERHFGSHVMRSVLKRQGRLIVERLGVMVLYSTLAAENGRLSMRVEKACLFGVVPAPLWLLPDVVADETASEGRLHFEVGVTWSWLGTLVGYSGYLEVLRDEC